VSDAPLIALADVRRVYVVGVERVHALDGVSFSVRRGEILGLIGPNGAGKTTLFECMAGVLPPSAGSILVANRAVAAHERSELLQDLFPENNPVLRPPVAGKIGLWRRPTARAPRRSPKAMDFVACLRWPRVRAATCAILRRPSLSFVLSL
jgi:energy-coupling factor transporter ATP-binding protein EcfA2